MQCTKCGTENAAGARFCNQCATPLSRACPKCAQLNAPDAKFCAECAEALTSDGLKSTARKSSSSVRIASGQTDPDVADGERKTVTALFADIKGSTELEQDLDPEEARAIVDPALKLMIDAVRRYDGYIVQSTGDGIFALFGAPVAHEDHPQRALYAALRMQEELRRYSARLREAGNLPIEARVGVNTGEVVVRSIATGDGTYRIHADRAHHQPCLADAGARANRVDRSQRADAQTGRRILRAQAAGTDQGQGRHRAGQRLRGDRARARCARGLQRSAGRGFTKFVGRQREMDAMRHAAEQAKAGHGQIVAAMAEAGVGKSRLLFEFKAVSQSGWMVLETFSVSHGKARALPAGDRPAAATSR